MRNKEECANMMNYYWRERGRLEGWAGDEYIEEEFPEIHTIYQQYKTLEKVLDVLVSNAYYNEGG